MGAADPDLTGKANFGFVSKYQRGANVPTGQTEFRFKVADLNFHSTEYEWLVVAGPLAQFKGSGTINGLFGSDEVSGYGFLLTARDGQAPGGGGLDKFRIKIVDKATDSIVYDNNAGASERNHGYEITIVLRACDTRGAPQRLPRGVGRAGVEPSPDAVEKRACVVLSELRARALPDGPGRAE